MANVAVRLMAAAGVAMLAAAYGLPLRAAQHLPLRVAQGGSASLLSQLVWFDRAGKRLDAIGPVLWALAALSVLLLVLESRA